MPTTHRRIQITRTPDVARAIDVAEQEWPEASRSELLSRLITRGAESVTASHDDRRVARRNALDATSGMLADAYEENYLQNLREDWPA